MLHKHHKHTSRHCIHTHRPGVAPGFALQKGQAPQRGRGQQSEALTMMTGSQKDVEYKLCGMLTEYFLASIDKTLKIWGFIEENLKNLNFY